MDLIEEQRLTPTERRQMIEENEKARTIEYVGRQERAEGRAEGLAEGRAEGRAEERDLLRKKLKEKGLGDDEIDAMLS